MTCSPHSLRGTESMLNLGHFSSWRTKACLWEETVRLVFLESSSLDRGRSLAEKKKKKKSPNLSTGALRRPLGENAEQCVVLTFFSLKTINWQGFCQLTRWVVSFFKISPSIFFSYHQVHISLCLNPTIRVFYYYFKLYFPPPTSRTIWFGSVLVWWRQGQMSVCDVAGTIYTVEIMIGYPDRKSVV